MNETGSVAAAAVPIRRPPPSMYLWTADSRIREIRRPDDRVPAPKDESEH